MLSGKRAIASLYDRLSFKPHFNCYLPEKISTIHKLIFFSSLNILSIFAAVTQGLLSLPTGCHDLIICLCCSIPSGPLWTPFCRAFFLACLQTNLPLFCQPATLISLKKKKKSRLLHEQQN